MQCLKIKEAVPTNGCGKQVLINKHFNSKNIMENVALINKQFISYNVVENVALVNIQFIPYKMVENVPLEYRLMFSPQTSKHNYKAPSMSSNKDGRAVIIH